MEATYWCPLCSNYNSSKFVPVRRWHVGVGGLVCGTPYTLGSSPSSKESRSWSRVSKNPARNTEETAVRLAPGKGTGTTLCRR
jgi:hypothetical protein